MEHLQELPDAEQLRDEVLADGDCARTKPSDGCDVDNACKDSQRQLYGLGKASSFDLLFPYGFSCDSDDTEPGHRNQVDGKYLGDNTMANGTVKWFNATKGFGFIAPAQGSKDVFVHVSALERAGIRQLDDGQAVTFDLETDRNGRESATNLALA